MHIILELAGATYIAAQTERARYYRYKQYFCVLMLLLLLIYVMQFLIHLAHSLILKFIAAPSERESLLLHYVQQPRNTLALMNTSQCSAHNANVRDA